MRGVLQRRVVTGAAFASLAIGTVAWLDFDYEASLRDVQYFNGWLLSGLAVGLLLLPLRKRLPGVPVGRVRSWLQVHYYAGITAFGVFLLHTRLQLPDAPIEWVLWGLFVLVSMSGAIGGLLNKYIPRRLEGHGGRVPFEHIEALRAGVARDAEDLVRTAVGNTRAQSLSDYYVRRLAAYFAAPTNLISHLRMSEIPVLRLVDELRSLERYLDADGKMSLQAMEQLVRKKDNLDFHRANAGLLKYWPFFHVPAAYALIAAVVIHVLVSYGFSAGVS